VGTALARILEHGSCKLYTISESTEEYKQVLRTLTGDNKNSDIAPELMNGSLQEEALKKISDKSELYLIHDPSDVRKPHSRKSENLGKVRDLNGNVINGYSTHNIVGVIPNDKAVYPLFHESYSNKDPKFLKAETIKKLEQDKDFDGKDEALSLYKSEEWFNKKTITKNAIEKVSSRVKSANPEIKITHILDREFDNDDYFKFICNTGDDFVIRAKKSRSTLEEADENGKKVKLINSSFSQQHTLLLEKIRLKDKCHQNATLILEWNDYGEYKAVRITIKDRHGEAVFKEPMLLITSKDINGTDNVLKIYYAYLKRSRIEYVFKFLKEGLGWEDMQIKSFQGIQNLLSLCFFLGAYLYEVGEQEAYDDYAVLLAEIGGGKGVVSRHFILKGVKALLTKYRVDRLFEKRQPSEETIEDMLAIAGVEA